jgi:hypothetical protein
VEKVRLAIEEEKSKQEAAKADIERSKMTLGLALLKKKNGLSTRNTSTVHTPADVDVSFDSNSSTAAVVDGAPSKRRFTDLEVKKLKEYANAFNSVLSLSGYKLMFYPSPYPTVVKFLSRSNIATEICSYTPEAVKNAYCAFILECESLPDKFLELHAKGELVKDYVRDGVRTPNALLPR